MTTPKKVKRTLRTNIARSTSILLLLTAVGRTISLLLFASRKNPNTPTTTPPDRPSSSRDLLVAPDVANHAIINSNPPSSNVVVDNTVAWHDAISSKNGSFVHVGKTAGSTISILLRNGCHSYMVHPCREVLERESAASQLIQNYYHVPDFGRLSQSQHDFYVVSCRDPFDRTVSAFVYEHILNRDARGETVDPWKVAKYEIAYQCFPTLQQYVELLGPDPYHFSYLFTQRSVNADSCTDLAKAALHGRVRIYSHLFFSFRRIKENLPDNDWNYDTFVVRKEFLWKDWKTLNAALGQPADSVYIPPESHSQKRNTTDDTMPVNRTLNAQGRSLLCRALEEEYRAYFWFLNQAKNLNEGDRELSIQVAKKNCPILAIRLLAAPEEPHRPNENPRELVLKKQSRPVLHPFPPRREPR